MNRSRVILQGQLRAAHGRQTCRIADLSAAGARLMGVGTGRLSEGDIVGLTIPGHAEFPAAIVWVNQDEAGLQFIDGAEGGLRRFGERAELLGVIS